MSKRSTLFYNRFSFFYPVVDVFLRPQKHILCEEIESLPDGDLLEIGVGNGSHLQLYKKHRVVAIDTSPVMLEIAAKHNLQHAELLQMNGEAVLFDDGRFDYVVLSHVLAVVDDPEQLLQEVSRVLRPNGRIFILNHFTPDNWLKYIDQAVGRLAKIFYFKSVFRIEELKEIERFTLLKEMHFGPGSYFKLLIYRKK
jgi:phosphatidylethanolamine/phosphatidyl-N-methylethanolamine N-methyltransferase